MKIYNAERREFSIHISVKKFWSENFGQQSVGGKTPYGHLQPDHWFKFVIDFRFRLSCHWWFIDGVVNTFSNAHYSQTTHPNWTKPSQGASPNVRISFGNNMGPNNFFCNFSSKCPAWAKCLIMACFPYMGSLLYTALYTAKSQGVHLLLPYLPVRQLCLQGGGAVDGCCCTQLCTQQKVKGYTSSPLPACEAAVVQSLPVCGSL